MSELVEILDRFNNTLGQATPKIASSLQAGLTTAEIEAQTASFSWDLPQDAYDLYQWHNGLSGKPGKLNWTEKLLRLKGKWHGELCGRENEIHLQLEARTIVAKFLPLEYALAGHRHLQLGRCSIDLLPIALLSDGNSTIYCMMRLNIEHPIVYCANGTKLPPMRVTESFLSMQPQFKRLRDLILFLNEISQQGLIPISTSQAIALDVLIDPVKFERLYHDR